MALKQCKECGKEVAEFASKCPHCGVGNPGTTWKEMLLGSLGLMLIILFGISFCSDDTPSPVDPGADTSSLVEPDVGYIIEKDEHSADIKRSVDVLLNEKIKKESLKQLGLKIKTSDTTAYQRTFIGYFIDGQDRSNGYWATTHFNPDLRVIVFDESTHPEPTLEETQSKLKELLTPPVITKPEKPAHIPTTPDIDYYKRQGAMLLNDLKEFRHDPEFHRVGFGICCHYNGWLLEAQETYSNWVDDVRTLPLEERFKEGKSDIGSALSWMPMIGKQWMRHQGEDDNFSADVLPKIKTAFQ